MQYRTFKKINEKTSLLGMGCMRLPVDSNDTVKEEETIRIIRDAKMCIRDRYQGGVSVFACKLLLCLLTFGVWWIADLGYSVIMTKETNYKKIIAAAA